MKVTSEKGIYEVAWPRAKRVVESVSFAQRLDALEGKTICALSDRIFRADEILPMIERELTNRYPDISFVSSEVFGSIHGGEEANSIAALPNTLKQNKCDAVISAIGC